MRKTCLTLIFLLIGSWAFAQVPQTLSYQGLLTDSSGAPVADGTYSLTFSLYTEASGGTALWTETHSATASGGVVSVILGSVTPFSVDFTEPYWLGLAIGSNPEGAPRVQFTAAAYSMAARGVYGSTNIFPPDGNVGIGTESASKQGAPAAKLDIEGDLRIADVPKFDDLTHLLVHDVDNQIVKFVHVDTLAARGFRGPPGPAGPVGPIGPVGPVGPAGPAGPAFGGIIIGIPLIIKDDNDVEVTRFNPDGTSFHSGLETYYGGIVLEGMAGDPGGMLLDENGLRVFNDAGEIVTRFNRDGTSVHKGKEEYWAGIDIKDSNGNVVMVLDENGLQIKDPATGVTNTQFNPDGTSVHKGKEEYWGGIEVKDSNGNVVINLSGDGFEIIDPATGAVTTSINKDGTSLHKGLETFEAGIEVQNMLAVNNAAGQTTFLVNPNGNPVATVQGNLMVSGTAEVNNNLEVGGNVNAGSINAGTKNFKIDHPLDPTNRYLYHTSIESPDMKNIYDGVVILDENGSATVSLPSYFEALNRSFRYQLTAIGAAMPALYIAEEVADNSFAIAGGVPGKKVSWQVTGIRHDPFAEHHRKPVEVDKPASERGTYLHPEAYGQSRKKSSVESGGQ